jgi:hypothetical protein
MPHIIVTAETVSGREVAMLAERVSGHALETDQAAVRLSYRIASAVADAAKREGQDPGPPPRTASSAGVP